jgi:CRP-like cAMP-binding protein
VTAVTDVTVGVLGAGAFNALVRDVPGMNGKLLRALARRLRQADLKRPAPAQLLSQKGPHPAFRVQTGRG